MMACYISDAFADEFRLDVMIGSSFEVSAIVVRDAAAFTLIKASGAIVWGASDVLQVRFSNLPSMQSLGDSSTTLGLLFASIGLACFIGPIVSNRFTPPRCAGIHAPSFGKMQFLDSVS